MNYRVLQCVLLLLLSMLNACHKSASEPDLQTTIEWMKTALAYHNGQRLDETLSKEVKPINRLTADHCCLRYELSNFENVDYDLSDIDIRTIKLDTIGKTTWVVFNTRDYHHSVRYRHPHDQQSDYEAENGGFSLDSKDVATAFAKALTRAVVLCGGRPSTF